MRRGALANAWTLYGWLEDVIIYCACITLGFCSEKKLVEFWAGLKILSKLILVIASMTAELISY